MHFEPNECSNSIPPYTTEFTKLRQRSNASTLRSWWLPHLLWRWWWCGKHPTPELKECGGKIQSLTRQYLPVSFKKWGDTVEIPAFIRQKGLELGFFTGEINKPWDAMGRQWCECWVTHSILSWDDYSSIPINMMEHKKNVWNHKPAIVYYSYK